MTDLEAALGPVREILARRDAKRRNGTTDSQEITKPLNDAVAALQRPAYLNGAAPRPSPDWELFDKNLAEVRQIAERLRNGAH